VTARASADAALPHPATAPWAQPAAAHRAVRAAAKVAARVMVRLASSNRMACWQEPVRPAMANKVAPACERSQPPRAPLPEPFWRERPVRPPWLRKPWPRKLWQDRATFVAGWL